MDAGWLIVVMLAICPLLWVISEFQSRVWLRILLGVGGMVGVFVVMSLLTMGERFETNSYFSFTNKELIESTIAGLKNGESERVLNELEALNKSYAPTYENKANYQELVRNYSKRLEGTALE